MRGVSIHAPAWGATKTQQILYLIFRVSIHAPAWGATTAHAGNNDTWPVSIHAPAWGATTATKPALAKLSFQSTLPRGERHGNLYAPTWSSVFQSTLPRGERLEGLRMPRMDWSFNPRSRVGSDLGHCVQTNQYMEFQSTLPRGERRVATRMLKELKMFQSTLPRGERPIIGRQVKFVQCFNPRSRVGSDAIDTRA